MFKLNKKKIKRLIIWLAIIPVLLFFSVVFVVYWKQDQIIQNLLISFNEDFNGKIEIEESHVSPFENFPYISIDLQNVKLFADKITKEEPILYLKDIYVGFNVFDLVAGNYDVKVIELKDGFIHAIQDEEGELNISKAFSTRKEVESIEEEFNIHLKSIELIDVDIYKLNEMNNLMVETFIEDADIRLKTNEEHVLASLVTTSEINILKDGDTSFFKHKHLNLDLEIEYIKESQFVTISPSELELENATFTAEGTIDFANQNDLNLKLYGEKENFDLFIAMAPEELISTLNTYDNAGNIKFNVEITGKSTSGYTPLIYIDFSCEKAFLENTLSHKKINELNFSGYFTNNGKKGLEGMEFYLNNFRAKPAAGSFKANLLVKNFEAPDIDMTLDSDFDLEFLAKFVNISTLKDVHGKVQVHMKFHDIIDLSHPEKSIERFNEAYYSELIIDDLGFKTSDYHLPLSGINTRVVVKGNEAKIEYFKAKADKSDITLSGLISDLPAIIHHMEKDVAVTLDIKSSLLDISKLSSEDKPIDEQIENLSLKLKFIGKAKSFTESENLPLGEFFIEELYADLKHYPHTLHDFNADLFIENTDFRIINFSGMIDDSDFHFNGKLNNYNHFLSQEKKGNVNAEFDLTSRLFKLKDIFSYKGENFVPEDYRHEEFSGLKVHGNVELKFDNGLKSTDLFITQIDTEMKVHSMTFRNFNGRLHYEDNNLSVQKLTGQIGKSKFSVDLNYYFGEDINLKTKDNYFSLKSNLLDFDELFSYNNLPSNVANSPREHEDGFNIYALPFPDMTFNFDVKNLNYHRYKIQNFKGKLRTTKNHYLYIDTLSMGIADGKMMLSGYFNGSNKDEIYFIPRMVLKGVDLDKLMFKFENFGQDYLVSENIHGKINSSINGKIRMHADLVPIIDKSEIHMDVLVLNGRLVNYAPIVDLKEYFENKNVNNVRFDTLSNHIDLTDGNMTIPKMIINSTLGYMIVSGSQDMEGNMEYYIKVPLNLIVKTGFKSLFGKDKKEIEIDKEDEIEYLDPNNKIAFVNLRIVGDSESFKVTLGKDKKKKRRK